VTLNAVDCKHSYSRTWKVVIYVFLNVHMITTWYWSCMFNFFGPQL